MNIAYIRVSTAEQNEERQCEALKEYNIDKFYSEKVSAKDTNRPQLKAMLEFAREGDTIYIHDFSRLARSTEDLLKIIRELGDRKIGLISIKENFDTSTPTGKLMLTMIAAINEFERDNLLERQREGIALAKARGVYKGRKTLQMPTNFADYFKKWDDHEMSKAEVARALGIYRPICNRFFAEYKAMKEQNG